MTIRADVTKSEPLTWQEQCFTCSSTTKAIFVAFGVFTLIAAAVVTGLFYATLGNWAFCVLAGGILLSLLSICLGYGSEKVERDVTEITIQVEGKGPNDSTEVSRVVPIGGRDTQAQQRKEAIGEAELTQTSMVHFSLIESSPDKLAAKAKVVKALTKLNSSGMTPRQLRAMGIMLGMATGDAIGAPFEFLPYKKEGYNRPGKTIQMTPQGLFGAAMTESRFELKPGQWTDDTSMGLCLADALLCNPALDETQLMWTFNDWWNHGYNNAFTKGEPRGSVGLGGNISDSLKKFAKERADTGIFATDAGTKFTSGNGSLMRLGPVAIVATTLDDARDLAWRQSKVTHQGDEAAGCCQLMASLLFNALHSEELDPQKRKAALFEQLALFECSVPSVTGLAQSNSSVNNPATSQSENWNWKAADFDFHAGRILGNPGYIGSYGMDALAMALHCVYTTDSFEKAVLKAATRGGDADTVGAITGQIAGAIYGIRYIPTPWIKAVQQWDRGGEIATRAYLLAQ